jgi:hypothetical protein
MDYTGGYTILAGLLASYPKVYGPRKAWGLRTSGLLPLPPAVSAATCSIRRLSVALCLQEAEWKEQEKPLLHLLLEKVPKLVQVRELSLEFKTMLEQKQAGRLEFWCKKALQFPGFKGFVWGIKQDFAAVYQAMACTWSSGQVEGQVNRLKTIKRQMYGKASFELLRIRVLAENCTNHLN